MTTESPPPRRNEPDVDARPDAPQPPSSEQVMRRHVRGSAVMLLGRGIGVLLNLAVQVLLVRALAVAEYGSFAFGLSIAAMGASTVGIGLDKGVSRFVALHEEKREHAEMAGVVLLALALVFATGVGTVGLIYLLSPWLGALVPPDVSLSVLLILVCLIPADALDRVMLQLLAIFASAKTVAIRRHIVLPALRLAAVGALLVFGQDVEFLALAWVLAVALSLVVSVLIMLRIFRDRELLRWFRPGSIRLRARPLLRFSLPLTSSDFSLVVRGQLVAFLLGILQTASAVAAYRAVLPVARLNIFVSDCFKTLFLPAAGRLCARDDKEGVRNLYWQTCAWILVLTFPVFVVSFTLSDQLSVFLFGDRYAESGLVLRWLAVGFFMNAVIGNNTLSLQQVAGHVRSVVLVDALTLVAALIFNIVLISLYAAIGGAIATVLTATARTFAGQWLLKRSGLVGAPTAAFVGIGTTALAVCAIVLAIEIVISPGWLVMIPAAVIATAIVTYRGIRELDLATTFPEIERIPVISRLAISAQSRARSHPR